MKSLIHLPASALTDRLYEIRKEERALLVEFLHYLNELDRRRIVLELGFPSLFAFCTDHLGLPKSSAYRRTTAAKLLARFPIVGEYLADGRLSDRTLVELRDVLQETKLIEILDRAAGRTEDQVKELVAALRPRPAMPDLFRRLPSPRADSGGSRREPVEQSHEVAGAAPLHAALPPAEPQRRPELLEPIAPELHVLRVTVSGAFKADLEAVRQELSHKLPGAGIEQLLHECLRVTLNACRRRRRGAGVKTTAKEPRKRSRFIPAAVRSQVWERDGGQCSFVGVTGHRCTSRHQLQVHHLFPFGKRGPTTTENLTLRCRAHNLYAAEKDYGREHMARKMAGSGRRADGGAGRSRAGTG